MVNLICDFLRIQEELSTFLNPEGYVIIVMKGVILAAGPGEALKPLTENVSKPMIRILDRPLIQFAIDRLVHSGIRDIIIVIPEGDTEIRSYANAANESLDLRYVQQKEEGLDAAIRSVQSQFSEDDQFILTHSDIVTNPKLVTRTLNAADNTGAEWALAVALQSETQDFGQVTLDANGLVDSIITSPDEDSSNYVVAGTFLLTGKIFNYLSQGFSFNECFNRFIADGGEVAGGIWNETWIDVGRPWDVLRATNYMLEKLEYSRIAADVKIGANVEIIGPVFIESGAEILNGTVLKGPVYVGKKAFIGNNSLIRDFSAIYDEAKIGMGVEIRSSVVMEKASIARLSYVGASIVGRESTMHSGAITINTNSPPSPIYVKIDGKDFKVPLDKFGAVIGPCSHIGVHTSLQPGTIVDAYVVIQPHQIVSGWVSSA
ncbi:MAG: sugar phosphate nucleotidyltransferase [Candidatus Kariarchaeaceae archaeon]|jgi:NDP-sugar pyrophosphorylase family protein